MSSHSPKPYWIDELCGKHEAYGYDDSRAKTVTIEHQGRSLQLIMPEYAPSTEVQVTASSGDFLFLLGEQLDEEDEDGEIIEGGHGVVMVARRHSSRDDTYWVLIWHELYPEALRFFGQ